MKTEEIIKICRERNEIDFLFQITKSIAEADSISEGYSYIREYTREDFNNAEKHVTPKHYKPRGFVDQYCEYIEYGSVPVYKLYLIHIGVLNDELEQL